jgi:hypothetical protein
MVPRATEAAASLSSQPVKVVSVHADNTSPAKSSSATAAAAAAAGPSDMAETGLKTGPEDYNPALPNTYEDLLREREERVQQRKLHEEFERLRKGEQAAGVACCFRFCSCSHRSPRVVCVACVEHAVIVRAGRLCARAWPRNETDAFSTSTERAAEAERAEKRRREDNESGKARPLLA